MALRDKAATPHVAQHTSGRRSAIDEGTAGHPGYAISQRVRKRVEEAFGWAKTVAGLRKMRHRGLLKVDWQFTLAMASYDLVRLPKLLAGLSDEPTHISNRAQLLRPRPFKLPQNASATPCRSLRSQNAPKSIFFQHPANLMRLLGVVAIYHRPNTSKTAAAHKIFPYLLGGLAIERINQVWCADIPYIPMAKGFLYLVVIMDWASRAVLAWRLSNTLGAEFCVEALEEALSRYGRPEIFNTDQGSQFTSDD
jgi:hypothetical protein